ncbi:MAG: S8 family serine peptidase [Gammaproteobacteria bacterium]|nr:S8 family serine peptidase [Gammaproteobacteria bacterium]
MIRNKIFTTVVVLLMLLSGATLITAAPPAEIGQGHNPRAEKTFRPDSILVRFKPGTPSEDVATAHANINPNAVKNYRILDGLKQITLPPGISVEKALENYLKNPNVLYAEPDYQYPINAVANDQFFNTLWALNNTSQQIPPAPYAGTNGTADADINAQEAWDNVIVPPATGAWNNTTGGYAETVIAVIDSGVDIDHPDLINNIWTNPYESASPSGADTDGNGYVDDLHGWNGVNNNYDPNDSGTHGTHVAGTIGAEGNNSSGVIGAAWHAKILPCRAGTGSSIDISAAISCLEYIYTLKTDSVNPVNIIASNNSWGGPGYSQALYDAIDANRQAGILFIAAAGNDSANNDGADDYPTNYHLPNVISVASTTNTDAKSGFSNYGRRSVHVGAPGEDILSTYPVGSGNFTDSDYTVFNNYSLASGTSMAAPQVSALAALIYTQDTNRDWKAIKNLILSSGTPVTAISTNTATGRRVRAWDSDGTGALTCVNQTVNTTLQPQATSSIVQGGKIGLAVLNINCDLPAGNVLVTSSGGIADTVLVDDGNGFDVAADDGIYSAYWNAPAVNGTYTLTFPDGQTATVTVATGLTPYRQPQSVTPVYETFNDYSGAITIGENAYIYLSTWFPIKFGDDSSGFNTTYIGRSGISFESFPYEALNGTLPHSTLNTLVAPFWDDLNLLTGSIHIGLTETTPNKHVIEWRNVQHKNHSGTVKFQVVFTENSSDIYVNYFDSTFGDAAYDNGASATIGMQVHNSSATQFSYNSASIGDNTSYLWQTNSGAPTSVNAGIDQNVTGNTTVNLSGSATDPDGGVISYSWAQISGTAVSLTNANTATPSFTAPNVTEALSFIMTAQDDAGFTGSDQVIINVTAAPTSGVLQLVNSSYSVAENVTTATISISRSSGATGAVSVDYATADGTATSGSDYTAASGTLNWADGDSANKTFNVTITDDVVDETDETLAINLSNVLGGATLGTAAATLTITDNDEPGSLSFSAATYTVSESGTSATITVSRTGGADNAIAVNYATTNGTAIAGSDYTSASGTLNWANADSADKTFTVAITDDGAYELDETIALSLSGATNGASLGTSSATLTITANDAVPGTLTLSNTAYSIAENAGTATITVSRTGGSDGTASVDYTTANGTATAGSDYTASSGTLNWANGDAADKTFTVAITNDTNYEPDETIVIALSNVASAALGTSAATLTITDNDAVPGTLALSNSTYSVAEDVGTATITVSRTGGSDGAVSIDFASANGTATAPGDYTATSGTLNWANGDATDKTFTVAIDNDTAYELDETIALTLSNATGGAALGTSSATLTITANDAAPGDLAFTASTYSVNENGSSVTITVSRTSGSDGAVSVNYTTANGSATAGGDYTANSGTLNWANGDATNKTFTVSITDDADYEGNETIALNLNTATGGSSLGTISSATLTIIEDETAPLAGTISFSNTSYTINEEATVINVTVSRIGGTAGAVSVNYLTNNISAFAGVDYNGVSSTLNWADGNNTDQTIAITLLDDAVYEPAEQFKITLSNASNGATIGNNIATITISANDAVPGSLGFSSGGYTVQETITPASITVNRTGGANGAVSVNYATSNATAIAGNDYSATSGTLNWADGDSSSKTISVPITNDSLYELDETVTLTLTNPSGGASLGSVITTTLTIAANDAAPGTLSLSSATYSVAEDGAIISITVSRSGGSNGVVSVNYGSTDGTAAVGTDYSLTGGTLTWADADSADKSFTIGINDNAISDGDKTLTISLLNNTAGTALGISNASLTIIDNESSNQAPGAPNLVSPSDGATGIDAFNMSFTWDTVTDPDGDAVNYQLFYCEDQSFNGCSATPVNTSLSSASMMFGVSGGLGLALVGMVSTASRRQRMFSMFAVILMALAFSGCGSPSTPPANPVFSQISYYAGDVLPGKTYYWKVIAIDGNGGQTSSPVWQFTTN